MQDIPVLLRKLTTKGSSRLLTSDVVDLVVLEGPVDLLHVGEHHLGVEPPGADHLIHVIPGNKVRNASKSSDWCKMSKG